MRPCKWRAMLGSRCVAFLDAPAVSGRPIEVWDRTEVIVDVKERTEAGLVDTTVNVRQAEVTALETVGKAFVVKAEFADEPWAHLEAARLEEVRLVALERRIAAGDGR